MYFDEMSLLGGEKYRVSENIVLCHPKIEDIRKFKEIPYFSNLDILTATPSQYKFQLFDLGIDYGEMSDYELFLNMYKSLADDISELLFDGVRISGFELYKDRNGDVLLYNPSTKAVISELEYVVISEYFRKIHAKEKVVEKYGNQKTKEYLIERDRRKYERAKDKEYKSVLKPLISAMVNNCHFKYDYETIGGMYIYTFYDSVKQIKRNVSHHHLMSGIYSGSVDIEKISQDELSFIDFQ